MDLTGKGRHGRYVRFTSLNSAIGISSIPQSEWNYNGGPSRGDFSGNKCLRGDNALGYIEIADPDYDMRPFDINATSKHTLLTYISHREDNWWYSLNVRDWFQYPILNYDDGAGKGMLITGSTHIGRFSYLTTGGTFVERPIEYIPYTTPGDADSCYDKVWDWCCETPILKLPEQCWCWPWKPTSQLSECIYKPDFTLRHYEMDVPTSKFWYRITAWTDSRNMMSTNIVNLKLPQATNKIWLAVDNNIAGFRVGHGWQSISSMIGPTVFYSGVTGLSRADETTYHNFIKTAFDCMSFLLFIVIWIFY